MFSLRLPRAVLIVCVGLIGCTAESPDVPADMPADAPADGGRPVEATSLDGLPLRRPRLEVAFREEQEALLASARAQLDGADNLEARVWVGRRLGYLCRFREALDFLTQALDSSPDDPHLLRHRGHRYLTVRRLSLAIADLERAAALVDGKPDEIEPDGLPNARQQPTSTLGTNIYYHLGLAHYARGEWPRAVAAYRLCLELSTNPDMRVATSYWLVLALSRQGLDELSRQEVAGLLAAASPDLDVIENQAYHRLLLAFRGDLDFSDLLEAARAQGEAAFATTGYGVGARRFVAGDEAGAVSIWRQIVATEAWPSFGFLAAEAELARLGERAAVARTEATARQTSSIN